VLSVVCKKVKESKYFSVSMDSSADVVHIDQLTFTIRIVDPSGEPKEYFRMFIPIESHDA
jgi:hypothetical protein